MDLFRRCMEPVEKVLRDAKMDKSNVRAHHLLSAHTGRPLAASGRQRGRSTSAAIAGVVRCSASVCTCSGLASRWWHLHGPCQPARAHVCSCTPDMKTVEAAESCTSLRTAILLM